jgi:cold shock CspA family protein
MQTCSQNKQQTQTQVQTGTCLWFAPARGYGFLVYGNGDTIFAHRDNIVAPIGYQVIKAGEAVSFIIGSDFKGRPSALKITKLQAAPPTAPIATPTATSAEGVAK